MFESTEINANLKIQIFFHQAPRFRRNSHISLLHSARVIIQFDSDSDENFSNDSDCEDDWLLYVFGQSCTQVLCSSDSELASDEDVNVEDVCYWCFII